MPQARDEAGNLWEIDGQGNAVRLLAPAAGPSPASGIGIDPYKARDSDRQDRNSALTASDRAADNARADRQTQLAEAKARREEIEWAAKFNPDGTPKAAAMSESQIKAKENADTKLTAARALKRQLGRMREIYEKDFKGSGLQSIREWLPSDAGQRFKAVAEAMRADLKPLIRGPGEGTFSEGDQRLLDSLIPQPESWDARNEERFDEIENRINDTESKFAPKTSAADPQDQKEIATGASRTEVTRGPVEKKLAAMLANGTPSAQIKKYASDNNYDPGKLSGALAYRALNPTYKGGYDVGSERTIPVTALNRAMASPAATVGLQAANAFTMGGIDEIAGGVQSFLTGAPLDQAVANADMLKKMQAEQNPNSALAGNILGGATALAAGGAALGGMGVGRGAWATANPIKASLAADAGYGSAYGFGESNGARGTGALAGGVGGIVGNRIGAGITRGIGGAMRGVVNPAVERLRAQGIPLTAGEALGGGWKKAQDAMTSIPGPGDLIARRYADGRRSLNEAAFNEAGATINTPINAVGQEGVDALATARSQAYGDALDPVTLDLANDGQFGGEVNALGNIISRIPDASPARQEAVNTLTHGIRSNIDPNGQMSGRNFQEAYRGLARAPRERGNAPYAHEFGQTMRGGQDALAGSLERQNPGAYEGFLNANSANRHMNILADAVKAAQAQLDEGDALFTPAQLGRASTNNTNQFGGRVAAAQGNRPFNQLVNDATEVMSSKVNNSGTVDRAAIMAGLGTAGAALTGGGIGYGSEGGTGAAVGAATPLAALALLNTRAGQARAVQLLLERAAPFRRAGENLLEFAPRVGQGTGLLGAYAAQPFATPR